MDERKIAMTRGPHDDKNEASRFRDSPFSLVQKMWEQGLKLGPEPIPTEGGTHRGRTRLGRSNDSFGGGRGP